MPSAVLCVTNEQAKDLARLACVCAELRDAASANDLWRPLFEAEFGEASLAEAVAGAHGWKALFRRCDALENLRVQPLPGWHLRED